MAVRTKRLAGECPHVALTPTQQGILAGIRNGNETEVPALLASKVEFLVSRDIAALMKKLDAQCADEGERTELTALFNVAIDFVEQFVGNTAALAEANGQLLREILEAAAAGMQALDTKMDAMLAGQDPRYTPEFIRFLDAEIARLRGGFRTPHLRARARARARAEKITLSLFASWQARFSARRTPLRQTRLEAPLASIWMPRLPPGAVKSWRRSTCTRTSWSMSTHTITRVSSPTRRQHCRPWRSRPDPPPTLASLMGTLGVF